MNPNAPIAIVGMGCLFPKSNTLAEYWANILAARDCTSELPENHSWRAADYFDANPDTKDKSWCTRGGFLDPVAFDPLEHGVPPTMLESIDSAQLLSLLVARAALRDAGLDPDGAGWDRERTSCILGITGTQEMAISAGSRLQGPTWRRALRRAGIDEATTEVIVKDIGNHFPTWTEQTFPGLLGNVVAGRIANRLDLGGTNAVVDAACASSLAALQYAASDLLAGRSDLVLSGGADTLNDAFMFQCFTRTPAFSRKNDARPFDASADGILIGEGIAILALMRLEDARASGRRIYAVLRGLGSSSDGRHKSIYAPNSDGQAKALRRAYAAAGFGPETIELVEAHGTGTKAGDAAEISALTTVFREARPSGRWAALGSVKSQIGHTKSTAGAAGLVKAALALYHKVLPPTARIERPNPKMAFEKSPFYLSSRARPWIRAADHPRRAAVSAFGFGGSNFHAVLEEEPVEARESIPAEHHLFLVGGTRESVDRALAALAADPRDLATRSAETLERWRPGGERIVGLVAQTQEALAAQVRAARAGTKADGVVIGDGGDPKVAFLFPGQGSQYVDMGAELAMRYPVVRSALDAAEHDALASRVFPPPAWTDEERQAAEAALTATDTAQPAIGALSKGLFDLLIALNVHPHAVAGHSYGELVALHAAGVYDTHALAEISRARGRHMAALTGERGTMAAVSGPLAQVDTVLAHHPDVVLANRNHPEQGVLSGSREGVARASESLQAAGFTTRDIPVSAAFHSPLVAAAAAPFRADLERFGFSSPRIPVWCDTTAEPYPSDPAAIRDLLGAQLAAPVDFAGIIEGLLKSGIGVFVEVGPRAVLAGLVRKCAGPRASNLTIVSLDRRGEGHDADRDLKLAVAALAAAGVPLDPRALASAAPPAPQRAHGAATVFLAGANHRNPSTREPPMPEYPRPTPSPSTGWGAVPSSGAPVAPPPSLAHSVTGSALTPAPFPSSLDVAALVASTREALVAFQASQERTADVHVRFLDAFAKSNETFAALFGAHARLLELAGGALPAEARAPMAPIAPVRPTPPPVASHPEPLFDTGRVRISTATTNTSTVLPPLFDARAAVEGRIGPTTPAAAPSLGADPVDAVLDAVAQKTGYPRSLLELTMELEADLGIDSIKRVEILSAVQERMPGLPTLDNERLSSLRTLAEVVAALGGGTQRPRPIPVVALGPDVADVLLDCVAAKTGYPRTLLELSMDLEADLGIDSIKRVEILSAVQERLPGLPELDNDRLSALRRLQDVLDALRGASHAPVRVAPAATRVTLERIIEAMLDAVAEKTGYPRNLLELGMDMESDLGIDSIKRVEILSAVTSRLPDLAEVSTDALNGLRTLNEVVALLEGKRPEPLPAALFAPTRAGVANPAALLGLPVDETSGFLGAPALLRPPAVPASLAVVAPLPQVTTGLDLLVSLDSGGPLLRREVREVPAAAPRPFATGSVAVSPGGEALAECLRQRGVPIVASAGKTDTFVYVGTDPRGAFHAAKQTLDARRWIAVTIGLGPQSAAVAAVAKTVGLETGRPSLAVCAETFDVARIADEIQSDRGVSELTLRADGTVSTWVEVATPAAVAGSAPIAAGELVVISGGARGVTAAVARALATAWRPALLLLGRSQVPAADPDWAAGSSDEALESRWVGEQTARGEKPSPRAASEAASGVRAAREVRKTLAELQVSGASVRYVAVDVRSGEEVAAAVSAAVAAHGPVRGLIHGAGRLADKRIADKTEAMWDAVWSTKVDGLRSLLACIPAPDLRFAAVFSSIAGRRGNVGQVDYAAANAWIGRMLLDAMPDGIPARVLDWGPWAGGMVGPALARQFTADGHGLVPLDAGAAAGLAELTLPGPAEIVLEGPRPSRGARSFRVGGSPAWLRDHTIGDTPVIPVARICSWFVELANEVFPEQSVIEIRDLAVLHGIAVPDTVDLTLRWAPLGEGLELTLENAGKPSYRATVRIGEPPALAQFPGSNGLGEQPWSGGDVYARHLFHGPSWQVIRAIEGTSAHGLVATIEGDGREPLLDGVLQLPLVWVCERTGQNALPTGFSRLHFYAPWPKSVTCHLEVTHASGATGTFTAHLVDAAGRVVGALEGGTWASSPGLQARFEQAQRGR